MKYTPVTANAVAAKSIVAKPIAVKSALPTPNRSRPLGRHLRTPIKT